MRGIIIMAGKTRRIYRRGEFIHQQKPPPAPAPPAPLVPGPAPAPADEEEPA